MAAPDVEAGMPSPPVMECCRGLCVCKRRRRARATHTHRACAKQRRAHPASGESDARPPPRPHAQTHLPRPARAPSWTRFPAVGRAVGSGRAAGRAIQAAGAERARSSKWLSLSSLTCASPDLPPAKLPRNGAFRRSIYAAAGSTPSPLDTAPRRVCSGRRAHAGPAGAVAASGRAAGVEHDGDDVERILLLPTGVAAANI